MVAEYIFFSEEVCERESERKRASQLIYNFSVPQPNSTFLSLPCSLDTQKCRRGLKSANASCDPQPHPPCSTLLYLHQFR